MTDGNEFNIVDGHIEITKLSKGKKYKGVASLRDDYKEELIGATWSINNEYLYNKDLGYLHKYIMCKWYRTELVQEMYDDGYVIDHMDNDHLNCSISNLEFLKKRYNTAKGQDLDIDRKEMLYKLSLGLYKDFSTGNYQITLNCNEHLYFKYGNKVSPRIDWIKLLYNLDYYSVINDAKTILHDYDCGRLDLTKLHFQDFKCKFMDVTSVTEDECKHLFIMRDGEWYINRDCGGFWVVSMPYDEGWKSK